MTATRTRPAYCLQCGQQAEVVTNSMDPGHPLVNCSRPTKDGRDFGHKRTLGTYALDEAETVIADRRAKAIRLDHVTSKHEGHQRADCPLCATMPVAAKATPHPFAAYPLRGSLVFHLENRHKDLELASRQTELTMGELTRLHDDAHRAWNELPGVTP